MYDTNIFNIQYKNEYAIKIKPYIILSDPYDLQTYNYGELLHYQILDDISYFSKYIVIFSIVSTKNIYIEPPRKQKSYILNQL